MARIKTARGRLGWREFLLSLFLIVVVWVGRKFINSPSDSGIVLESDTLGAIDVLFTSQQTEADTSVADELGMAIAGAQSSVDLAVYDLALEQIADALVDAHSRGVSVRLVTETDYEDEAALRQIQRAGIPVVADSGDPLMHNKFVVVDREQVWTGSWNLTYNGTYRNNNNVVVVHSPRLAENYTAEFEEMFVQAQFGSGSPDDGTPYPYLELDGVVVETLFAPEDDVRARVLELVSEAQESISFMAFAFTDDEIARSLVQKSRTGLNVQGVLETRTAEDRGAEFAFFQQSGVDVRLDGNPYMMHHKVMVIDEHIVVTGSYNFTRSAAERNDENVLIIRDAGIAARYVEEFQHVYQMAEEAR